MKIKKCTEGGDHCWHSITHSMFFGGYDHREDFCCWCCKKRDTEYPVRFGD